MLNLVILRWLVDINGVSFRDFDLVRVFFKRMYNCWWMVKEELMFVIGEYEDLSIFVVFFISNWDNKL